MATIENNGNRQATLAYDLGLMLKRELTTFCKEIELLPQSGIFGPEIVRCAHERCAKHVFQTTHLLRTLQY